MTRFGEWCQDVKWILTDHNPRTLALSLLDSGPMSGRELRMALNRVRPWGFRWSAPRFYKFMARLEDRDLVRMFKCIPPPYEPPVVWCEITANGRSQFGGELAEPETAR